MVGLDEISYFVINNHPTILIELLACSEFINNHLRSGYFLTVHFPTSRGISPLSVYFVSSFAVLDKPDLVYGYS